MALPTFIGIGTQRSGSTWLHLLLQSHPQVYMPTKRKEIHYFDQNYDKGLTWYKSFFPQSDAEQYRAIGEFTPAYMHHPDVPERIAALASVQKLMVILRNPVDRAYSAYGHYVRMRNYNQSFEAYLNEFATGINFGLYSDKLADFLQYYDQDKICCFVFEEAVRDVETTKERLASFLGIDVGFFPELAGQQKANETYIPKFKQINRLATKLRTQLIKAEADWLVLAANKLGIKNILKMGGGKNSQLISGHTRQSLYYDYFKQDIEKLEHLMNLNLGVWKL